MSRENEAPLLSNDNSYYGTETQASSAIDISTIFSAPTSFKTVLDLIATSFTFMPLEDLRTLASVRGVSKKFREASEEWYSRAFIFKILSEIPGNYSRLSIAIKTKSFCKPIVVNTPTLAAVVADLEKGGVNYNAMVNTEAFKSICRVVAKNLQNIESKNSERFQTNHCKFFRNVAMATLAGVAMIASFSYCGLIASAFAGSEKVQSLYNEVISKDLSRIKVFFFLVLLVVTAMISCCIGICTCACLSNAVGRAKNARNEIAVDSADRPLKHITLSQAGMFKAVADTLGGAETRSITVLEEKSSVVNKT